MRRRLTVSMLAMVAAAVVLVGLGSLVLARIGTRDTVEEDLRRQAELTASILKVANAQVGGRPQGANRVRNRFAALRNALSVEDVRLVLLGPDDQVVAGVSDELPAPVRPDDLDAARLHAGETVSGTRQGTAYAAVALPNQTELLPVIVLTRPAAAPAVSRDAVRWFTLAAALTLLLALAVAARLSRQLAQPLSDATEATKRIAGGDLSTRLPEHPDRRRHPDEIEELARSINTMAASLERYQGLERQFLLSVSHDLRTPLTSIRGWAEAVADGTAPDAARAGGVILAESRRLERLVGDLLDLAKLESRAFTLQMGAVDLAELATDTVDGFRRQVEEAGLHIEVGPTVEPAVAWADRDRLQQVLANLVENAIGHATATIRVEVVGGTAPALVVRDDGPGIDPVDLPHVFERLYRASHEPQRRESGSGLGLAIVRELSEAMGGRATAEADPGGGARLVVALQAPPPAPTG